MDDHYQPSQWRLVPTGCHYNMRQELLQREALQLWLL